MWTPAVSTAGFFYGMLLHEHKNENDVYNTLEEVIDFYDKGGAEGLGISPRNQTLPAEPLNLTKEEKNAIIQFLHALTDR